mgnify:CR=1 FL=1|jgi:hypothetical protein
MTISKTHSISVFVIATNAYVEYALNLIRSSSRWGEVETQIQFLLLTDSEIDVHQFDHKGNSITVSTFRIPSYGWPEATLLRFHLMADHWEHVTGEIVMYLDADTEIVSPLIFADLFELSTKSTSNGVTPVLHPGYFNRSRLRNALNQTRLGPWENRRHSTAYVPYKSRKNYVCGGVIWGLNKAFFQLCTDIKAKIDMDLLHNIVAKHNDESHLNNWFTIHPTIAATPEWAFASGYSNLAGLVPRIEVIHKPATFNRIPTKLD